jgi:hypothetical protein
MLVIQGKGKNFIFRMRGGKGLNNLKPKYIKDLRSKYLCEERSNNSPVLTTFSPSQHMATTGPRSMYLTRPLKNGLYMKEMASPTEIEESAGAPNLHLDNSTAGTY